MAVDASDSSGLAALEQGLQSIHRGECVAALPITYVCIRNRLRIMPGFCYCYLLLSLFLEHLGYSWRVLVIAARGSMVHGDLWQRYWNARLHRDVSDLWVVILMQTRYWIDAYARLNNTTKWCRHAPLERVGKNPSTAARLCHVNIDTVSSLHPHCMYSITAKSRAYVYQYTILKILLLGF